MEKKMKVKRPFISVIIPVYNEEERLVNFETIYNFFKSQKFSSEIIFVNDGSKDKTLTILKKLRKLRSFKLINYEMNRGKGYAIKTGMLSASGEHCLFFDIDLSTPLEELFKFLIHFGKYDVIIGTRKKSRAKLLKRQSLIRENLGKAFTLLSQITLQVPVSDFTCGFKYFSKQAAEDIFTKAKINRWGFDSEILFIATRKRLKIKEIPVTWKNDPQTKVRFPQDIINSLQELALIRWHYLRKAYR